MSINISQTRRSSIAVIGSGTATPDSRSYQLAVALGHALVDHNYRIVSGGMHGVMEAIAKGARKSIRFTDSSVIALLPGFDPEKGNDYNGVIVPTGLDTFRNGIVANSDAVIALGGGAGTLSELALAWILNRMVIAYRIEGWSGQLADKPIDSRQRMHLADDRVYGVDTAQEVLELLKSKLSEYGKRHSRITS